MKTQISFLEVLIGAAMLLPSASLALIMTGRGNDPVSDAGWPAGALAVANLKSRVGWWEGPPFGGGQWQFLYRGDTAAFAETLAAFAAIRAPALDLVVHDEPGESTFLKDSAKPDADTHFDWSFTVWVPANWHHLYNNPKSFFGADQPQFRQPVDPPRLDLYVRAKGVDFSKIKLPGNVRLKDERPAAFGVSPVGGAVVRVDLFDMTNAKPIAGAHVLVARLPAGANNQVENYEKVAEAVSDGSGRAQVEKIPAGTVRISVTASGYAPRLLVYDSLSARSFRPFTVSLAKAASLRGIAVDSDNKPVPGVKVRAASVIALDGRGYPPPDSPNPAGALTDENGHFTLADLPTGFTTLSAHKSEYHFGDLFTLHEVPGAGEIRLRLTRACKVHVAVTDKAGKPLAKFENAAVLVAIEPKEGPGIGKWSGSADVKPDGTYDFVGMPAGEYRITSRPNPSTAGRKYAPDQIIKVEPGGSANVTVVYE